MDRADMAAANFQNIKEAPPVTMASLLQHFNAYGLENANQRGYRGKPVRYGNYKALRKDALVHVARTFLMEDAYVQLLDRVGYPEYEDQARADWQVLHG